MQVFRKWKSVLAATDGGSVFVEAQARREA